MAELCAHKPCKCLIPEGDMFCGEVCAMLGASVVNRVGVSSVVPLKSDDEVVSRCPCGHEGCGDSLVSESVN